MAPEQGERREIIYSWKVNKEQEFRTPAVSQIFRLHVDTPTHIFIYVVENSLLLIEILHEDFHVHLKTPFHTSLQDSFTVLVCCRSLAGNNLTQVNPKKESFLFFLRKRSFFLFCSENLLYICQYGSSIVHYVGHNDNQIDPMCYIVSSFRFLL